MAQSGPSASCSKFICKLAQAVNVIFILIGVCVLVQAVYYLSQDERNRTLLGARELDEKETYLCSVLTMFFVGMGHVLFGWFGLSVVNQGSQYKLVIYIVLLFCAIAVTYRVDGGRRISLELPKLQKAMRSRLESDMRRYSHAGVNCSIKHRVDFVQSYLRCCGVLHFDEWTNRSSSSHSVNSTSSDADSFTVDSFTSTESQPVSMLPESCCSKDTDTSCDELFYADDRGVLYQQGCWPVLWSLISADISYIQVALTATTILQIIGVPLAIALLGCCSPMAIKQNRARRYNAYV